MPEHNTDGLFWLIGAAISLTAGATVFAFAFQWMLSKFVDRLLRCFKIMQVVLRFMWHRKEFMKWHDQQKWRPDSIQKDS